MSAIGYGVISRLRVQAQPDQAQPDQAQPDQGQVNQPPGMQVLLDGLAAIVPGEMLILHGVIVAAATVTITAPDDHGVEKVTSTFAASSVPPFVFWLLVAICVPLYVIGRVWRSRTWRGLDWLRMLLPSLAFVAWTMLGEGTLADSAFGAMNGILRLAIGGCLGLVVSATAISLGMWQGAADAQP